MIANRASFTSDSTSPNLVGTAPTDGGDRNGYRCGDGMRTCRVRACRREPGLLPRDLTPSAWRQLHHART